MKTIKVLAILFCGLLAVASNAQTFIYDGVGRVSIVRYDGGLETRYAYDKNGNITSIKTQIINSVTEDATRVESAMIAPNPATDNAVVVLGELVSGMDVAVKIRDLAGRMLVERTTRCENDRITVDVSTLASGTYLVECSYTGAVRTAKLNVQR